ncbi:carboxypeptidase-like regulatory domain-containing protein [Hymenobacter gummosus]|uniref:Carboxypeptidase-like regulatory domain-containing protein n=1 Tax=Hymenobacter gummosus TaxID=1776032 RepID=A0A431TZY9_9BACT|nr:carboxypeptidase-like regulatory domain-containing protein [Hymenobacter gummosus]RTQ47541.1 carboxypeptidase-like regulatory domain-containing protein [Hymenobacter gummosus]
MPHRYPIFRASRWLTAGRLSLAGAFLLATPAAPVAQATSPGHPVSAPAPAPTDTAFWRLRGRVLDAYTAEPLPYAALWLKHLTLGTQSDEQGYFSFTLSAEQLADFPADTLQITAPAFRLQAQPIVFGQQPADSLLRIVLARDSAVAQHAPLLAATDRRSRRAAASAAAAAATPPAAVPRRSFWQRLFGGR